MRKNFKTFLKYALSGIVITSAELLVLGYLVHQLKWWYLAASSVVFLSGLAVSFLIRKYWVFKKPSKYHGLKQLFIYATSFSVGGILNLLIMYYLVEKLLVFDVFAQVISISLISLFFFLFNKKITFSPLINPELSPSKCLVDENFDNLK